MKTFRPEVSSESAQALHPGWALNDRPAVPGRQAQTQSGAVLEKIRAVRIRGFTLIELLVVIAIIGLLAGLAAPVLHNFRPNYTASVMQQLLTDIARARQLAISQHTTVYMVFVPTNFWKDPAYGANWTPSDFLQASNLLDKQTIGYNFVSLHSMGDQPGRPSVHYLSSWKSLPEGGFIYPLKFVHSSPNLPVMTIYTNSPTAGPTVAFRISGFNYANGPNRNTSPVIPFPQENTQQAGFRNPYILLPYIAFDYMGRLVSGPPGLTVPDAGELIPISRGSVIFSRDATKRPRQGLPSFNEQPVGNVTNGYNLVYVDNITGRARALQLEIR
ncbi:MAG TPA: prepilin-type N-terminal cleavage/methylation domain-containing protein [Verrucomicrobiae bacterium]|nr:prepilin-type N-terminal cleavage/methylation domain-containing protein [Verrucomicrobiae bacterium]